MNIHSKILLIISALFGAISVAIAAVGAHGLHNTLVLSQQLETFAKAIDYTTTGALILAIIAGLQIIIPRARLFISGYLLALGTTVFSGSLFVFTLASYQPITMITPMGGTLLIIGWLSIALLAIFQK